MNAHTSDESEGHGHDPDEAVESAGHPTRDDGPHFSLEDLIEIEGRIREGKPVSKEEQEAYEEARDKVRESMSALRFKTSDIVSPATMGMIQSIRDQHDQMTTDWADIIKPITTMNWPSVAELNFKVPKIDPETLIDVQKIISGSLGFGSVTDVITTALLNHHKLSFVRADDDGQIPPEKESKSPEVERGVNPELGTEIERSDRDEENTWELASVNYQNASLAEMRDIVEGVGSLYRLGVISNSLQQEQISQNNQTNTQLSMLHDRFTGVSSDLSAIKEDIRRSSKKTNLIAGATLVVAFLTLIMAGVTLFAT